MYRLFTLLLKALPLKLGTFALSALFILTACGGGFTIDLNSVGQDSECSANPFLTECDSQRNISAIRTLIIEDCASSPEKANTRLCLAADAAFGAPSDNENGAEDAVAEVGDNTPKDNLIKPESDKEKGETTTLEIVDLCSDPANANNERCTPAVLDCITNPFSGRCQGDNLLGNFVKGGVTVSKTVVLQDKRAEDCRTGRIDRALCQNLSVQKQRCAGAAFSTDAICSAVAYSVCKADAFDPLCGEKEDFQGVYFNERSNVCFEDPNNPNCTGTNGHVAVVCSEYPLDRLCTPAPEPTITEPTITEGATPQVTAKVWADSFDTPLSRTPSAYDTSSKFLIARETDLDRGGVSPLSLGSTPRYGNLNFADATFNGRALGGDRADGVGFFAAEQANSGGYYVYAGILSGTNLGAPLTDTQGSAKWTGAFQLEGRPPVDFLLNISFGTGAGAGEIEGLVQNYFVYGYQVKGEFDDTGVITGTAVRGLYRVVTNKLDIDSTSSSTGKLSGLIGEEGAIGAVLFNHAGYYGGFVARPSTTADLADVARVCANDPFHSFCATGYESERNVIIEHCIIGGNANDASCDSANDWYSCINKPFLSNCDDRLPQYYQQARANREAFCRTAGNAGNALCTVWNTFRHICTNYPFTTQCLSDDRFTSLRRTACTDDPFTTRCAGDGYNDLRVSFCLANVGTHPSCPAPEPTITEITTTEITTTEITTPQVTAKVWADSFDEPLATAARDDDVWSEFLIGRATDLDDGGVRGYYDGWRDFDYGNFNLADATFNGVALGGDAEDGMAFFASNIINSYAGILSGTNLGAPLTQTVGTAKWIGSFKVEAWTGLTDFVLNVSFGTGDGAGEIEALVQLHWYSRNYHIKGEFDDAGVITGTAPRGTFRTHDPDNRGLVYGSGRLTGLIGEEGAVGAIIVGDYYAGFVARPSSAAELRNLEETCADDPFHKWCNLGYEAERNAVVEHCIIDDNALNVERCGSVNKFHLCIKHPFLDDCNLRLSSYYEQTRANRIAFCRTVGNADNALCTIEDTFAYICKKHPFDVQCLGNDRFMPWRRTACTDDPFAPRCAGDGYNDLRVTFCARNASNPACPVLEPTITEEATPQVTAKVWADSFEQPLSHAASAADIWSKLLVGRATDLNNGGLRTTRRGNLNLADATFNGVALGGEAEDGMAFFASYPLNSYAGILSGTNLGAPLTDTAGSAKWVGSFLLEVWSRTDFVLNVSFGTGDGAGEIEGLVQLHPYYLDVHVKGEFDDTGVITGTVARGIYRTNDPNNRGVVFRHRGRLTGLIGEEGAVGAFTVGNYYGGFVARPSSSAELENVEETCADDPFHKWCNLGYETERDAILDHCIIGGNANDERCGSANELDDCINDPFQSNCDDRLPQYYQQARANRLAFCRTAGNAGNALCTVEDTFAYICTNHPFDTQCLGDGDYNQNRRTACTDDPFATRCAGAGYNDLRVTFCENNAGNPACPRPEPTTPQVTASVWADSFDTPLATAARSDDTNNKFLIGRATDLNNGGVTSFPYRDAYNRANLNLADATFNGVALGGDRADGVAFFAATTTRTGRVLKYAGILSGTNLGAPLTDTIGTAKWIGSFRAEFLSATDFVLNVSFGTGDGAGEIEALVQRRDYSFSFDYHLKGEFDDAGVITGAVRQGYFRINDPDNRGSINATTELTGLIGEEGAVGAFVLNGGGTSGFVARPSSVAELQTLAQTCAADPFNRRCTVGYESQRNAVIEHCITGGNANDERCGLANEWYPCINNPFSSDCKDSLPQHYEQVRANRVAFCRTAGNADNALCTTTKTFVHICRNHPFTTQCLGNSRYEKARQDASCRDNPSCSLPEPTANPVTTADWLASFNSPLSAGSTSVGNHFVKAIATGLDGTTLRSIFGSDPNIYTLNLAYTTYKGQSIGGDVADGVVIFRGLDRRSTNRGPASGEITHYAGILPGTNLGAPVNEPDGTAIWYGYFRASGHEYANKDFALHINFGDGDGAGTLHASVIEEAGGQHYKINGRFDDNGVITGTSNLGRYGHNPGVLRGLIGEEGAVGVFISNALRYSGYVGGFVATPELTRAISATPPVAANRVTTADWLASFETAPAHVADVNRNHFLQIWNGLPVTRTHLNFRTTTNSNSFTNISPYSLTLDDDIFQDGGGSAADGMVFYKAHNGDESDSYFYAGILPETDLGAPLSETSGTATWSGRFHAVLSGGILREFSRDFTLDITFNATGGDISTAVSGRTEDYFELDGTFNKQGVISGTANHVYYENGRIGDVTGDIVNSGPVAGLIGQEGAVGMFISNRQSGNTGGFAGGFVARPIP